MKKLALAAIALAVLSGCAENPAITQARSYVQQNSPMVFTKDQCEMKWQQTEYYISQHSPMKIETSTPTTIQTFNQVNTSLGVVQFTAAAHRLPTTDGCKIDVNVQSWGYPDWVAISTIMKEVKSS